METARPRTPLTRERVLDAAIELAVREGVAGISMRRLGEELGVHAMSLYNHVASKQDLLDGVAGRLLARMRLPFTDQTTWEDGVRLVCRAYRQLAHEYPALFPLVLARPLAAPEALPPLEATLRLLRQAGLDEQAALDVFQVGASFVGGFALGEINERRAQAATDTGAAAWIVTPVPPDRFPVTAQVLRRAVPDPDRAFELGLDLLVSGLRTLLPSP